MKMHPKTRQAYELLHDATLALADIERHGIHFDEQYANKQYHRLSKKIEVLEKKLKSSTFYKEWQMSSKNPVNINSNPQLRHFLYKVKGYTPASTTKKSGEGSTSEDALEALKIPELDILLKIRKLKKLRDTYLGSFTTEQSNGIIHPFFNLHNVITFRSSSSKPNFQNIPKREETAMTITRRCLIPSKGNLLLEGDYGQLEVRIAACYNQDPKLIDDIVHGDMHADMASEIFFIKNLDKDNIKGHSTLRKAAKNGFIFPEFYGDYFGRCAVILAHEWGKLPEKGRWGKNKGIEIVDGLYLSDHLRSNGIKDFDDFKDHIEKIENDFWNKRYPVYRDWKESLWSNYQEKGYIDLKTGFRCQGVMDKNNAINYPVQGAAFHCLLWSLIRIHSLLNKQGFKTKIIGQIHDAIIFDVYPPELEDVKKLATDVMTRQLPDNWDWITVPLEVEFDEGKINESWDKLK